jgi:hypothetical protein
MHRFPLLIALLGLALSSSVVIPIAISDRVPQGPVYAVVQVQAGLAEHPQAWVGRTVRVRGLVKSCPYVRHGPCARWQPALSDTSTVALSIDVEPLPLVRGSASPLLAGLRRVPFLGSLTPAPQELRWDTPTIYRVQLRTGSCGMAQLPCYEALLLDAGPPGSW